MRIEGRRVRKWEGRKDGGRKLFKVDIWESRKKMTSIGDTH